MHTFRSSRSIVALLAVVGVYACSDASAPEKPLATQLKAETQNIKGGKFITTLRLPVPSEGTSLRHCEPNGSCVRALFHPIYVRDSTLLLSLEINNPTDHPLSVRWRCPHHLEGTSRPMRGEADYWHVYTPGITMSIQPVGGRCVVADRPAQPRMVEVEITWADHDVIAAAREAEELEKSRQRAAQLADHERLQREVADKIKRVTREEAKFMLTLDFTVFVWIERATIEGAKQGAFASTISRIEFRDTMGVVLHHVEFPTEVQDYGNGTYEFRQSCSIFGLRERVLAPEGLRLIELRYECDPSAPGYTLVHWYGLDATGRFRAVRSPLDGFSGSLTDHTHHPGLKPDRIYAEIHTGYAGVVVPYTFNRQNFSLEPDYSSRFLIADGSAAFRVQKTLRLALRDQPGGKVIATLMLTPTSKTRFLRAYVEKAGGNNWLDIAPWMEVEADGRRGWVNLRDDEGLSDALLWSG